MNIELNRRERRMICSALDGWLSDNREAIKQMEKMTDVKWLREQNRALRELKKKMVPSELTAGAINGEFA